VFAAVRLGLPCRQPAVALARGWGHADPSGLVLGLAAVAMGQCCVLFYYTMRRAGWLYGFCPAIQASAGGAQAQAMSAAPARVQADIAAHVSSVEGLVLLGLYLSAFWLSGAMPASYYQRAGEAGGGVMWWHVLQQLLCQDLLMWVSHRALHVVKRLYFVAHKPHHVWISPRLTNAFDGSLADTTVMILLPLLATAYLLPWVNVWSYMAFGTVYSVLLCLIHSEYNHPWDPVLRLLGVGTAADHHVHHKLFLYNYGHIFTYWDRLAGTYKSPLEVEGLVAQRYSSTLLFEF
jgi:sterol desaturase/sphingolipid hydroxylase (fatty acid hydroxylase superfamily)